MLMVRRSAATNLGKFAPTVDHAHLKADRHQLLSLSSLGYRCITPNLRGFRNTDTSPSQTSYTAMHMVSDLIGLLDHLGIDQVFLVTHD
ncbi:hypothetical protein ACFX13_043462 [Malus domestica]|uniref:AB hydrolase-1 domain-containing protein n=1 Tax=Malus domestica TaxID=3750 RepID=A0A498JB29_MALDO|nr:hypothetical protein DVH24_020337 [Malus domestica]